MFFNVMACMKIPLIIVHPICIQVLEKTLWITMFQSQIIFNFPSLNKWKKHNKFWNNVCET
jgi:hypothetical protein